VKMMEGIIATSYNEGDKFYIDPMKLLPLSRFLPQPKYELVVVYAALFACHFVKMDPRCLIHLFFLHLISSHLLI
jgi:hypothetical protein